MADFTTLRGRFDVLVNDGLRWALYPIEASSERAAHATAASVWAGDPHKTAHADEPMPTEPPVGQDNRDAQIASLTDDMLAAEKKFNDLQSELNDANAKVAELEAENASLKHDLEEATRPTEAVPAVVDTEAAPSA